MRIGIYGPFGWGNMGDAAIQEAMLANVRARCAEAEFLGISLNPTNTQAIHGIDAVPIHRRWSPPAPAPTTQKSSPASTPNAPAHPPRRHPLVAALRALLRPVRPVLEELLFCARCVKTLRALDLLVISGGGQISDDWGGPMDHPWSMFAWSLCARLAGTPVVIVSVGAGPIDHPWSRRFFFAALRLARYRSVRDEESLEFLRRSGCTLPVEVYPDLAFSHPLPELAHEASDPARVGLSPMSYCHPQPGLWPEQDAARYERLAAALAGFGESAMAGGHPVHLFSNQIRNDLTAFTDIQQRLPQAAAEPTRDLAHLLRQVEGGDVVITSRLHGVILSYLLGRPVIALSFQSKIDAVVRQFGQQRYRIDIDAVSAELLSERFALLLGERDAIAAHIRDVAASHRRRLDEQYDRLFGPRTDGT